MAQFVPLQTGIAPLHCELVWHVTEFGPKSWKPDRQENITTVPTEEADVDFWPFAGVCKFGQLPAGSCRNDQTAHTNGRITVRKICKP